MPAVTYLELLPKAEVSHLIKCFWISSNESGSDLHFTTLPDGCIELILFFQQHQLINVSVFGILSDPYDMVMPDGEIKVGIRFKPLAKEYYLDKCETLARFASFTEHFSDNLSDNLQLFSEKVTADMQVPIVDARKQRLFDLLRQSSGDMDVKTLSEHCYWPSRQINRYFNSHIGISLKSYINVLKCYATYSDIKVGQLYPANGYYDQSHFIREIKKHTGTTPKILLKNEAHRYLQFNDRVIIPDR